MFTKAATDESGKRIANDENCECSNKNHFWEYNNTNKGREEDVSCTVKISFFCIHFVSSKKEAENLIKEVTKGGEEIATQIDDQKEERQNGEDNNCSLAGDKIINHRNREAAKMDKFSNYLVFIIDCAVINLVHLV